MRFIAELDGNNLCIKRDDFVNLAESHAVFVELDDGEYAELYKLMDIKHCKKCNRNVVEYTNHKGLCEDCEIEQNSPSAI